jgi:hypothetical protein
MRASKGKNSRMEMTREWALKCTPVKNTQIKEKRLETGEVLLAYPIKTRPWIASIIRRFGGPGSEIHIKRLQLDRLGTSVWDLMDGRRSVRQIVRRFASQYQLNAKEAEVAVTQFLRTLGKRGLIGLK